MIAQIIPESFYQDRITELSANRKKLLQQKSNIAWYRFFSVAVAFGAFITLWSSSVLGAWVVSIFFIGLFIFFLIGDLKNNQSILNTETLITINKKELEIHNHQFNDLPDGLIYKSTSHDYANDLDIFGNASLFQYINRTTTEQAGILLSKWMLAPATASEIVKRQSATKELSLKAKWRQQLQAYGTSVQLTKKTEEKISTWLLQPDLFNSNYWRVVRICYPIITITLLGLYLAGNIAGDAFTFLFVVFITISMGVSKIVMPAYNQLNKITREVETLGSFLLHIESENFEDPFLNELKNSCKHTNANASGIIKKLKTILDRFDIRFNIIVFIPLNAFLLWDLQQVFTLERWKKEYKKSVSNWYNIISYFETLSTLATLSFNHPHWCFPQFSEEKGDLSVLEMGHPLIPIDKLVTNTFSTSGTGKINLITGSNMAGKSTFLRSIGVNTVLAMMGAPVCAKEMKLYPTRIISTMRVNDNLEESTSTFYAELKKLKIIIEAVNNNENVFLLMDEILRGTNSNDRHTGSEALLKQLIEKKAVGLLATHDLELAKPDGGFPENSINYHFDVQVNNEELYFDYQLKRGICRSMNASLLMKKIGIEL